MTYRPAIGESMRALGCTPGPAHYLCDTACRARFDMPDALPPTWSLRHDHAPPGWTRAVHADGYAVHYCPACSARRKA